ncbi:MAG TPA: Clp protease N-terminal domain-containing protein [Gaiellaceae bacterium]|nr:Clp protease N-terminal domain-containing protein [Gaiellaceae bacterium]
MFERFTEGARQVVVLGQDEARALRHGYIGTEHLLLGLLREKGRAGTTLAAHGIDVEAVRAWVAENVGRGRDEPPAGQLPLTPRLKRILEMSLEEADTLGHHAIGTQHLLIALLHEGQGAALRALDDLGAPPEEVWISAYRQLGVDAPPYVPAGLPSGEQARESRPLAERVPSVAVAAGAAAFVAGLFLGWLIWG